MNLINEANKWVNDEIIKEDIFSTEDSILDGITYQELIDAVVSNEQVRDEDAIIKVFSEMLSANIENAKEMLNSELPNILANIEKETENH
jgi:hypothetical protein